MASLRRTCLAAGAAVILLCCHPSFLVVGLSLRCFRSGLIPYGKITIKCDIMHWTADGYVVIERSFFSPRQADRGMLPEELLVSPLPTRPLPGWPWSPYTTLRCTAS